MKYSQELIDRCIKVFAEEHNHHINEETAEEYLDSFADLFLAMAEIDKEKSKSIK